MGAGFVAACQKLPSLIRLWNEKWGKVARFCSAKPAHKWECRPDVPQHSLHDPVDAKSVVGPISTVATEAGQSGHFRSSSNLPEIRGFGLGRKVPNSDIAFGNGRVTFR